MGKLVIEDVGINLGRTRDWPSVPRGIDKRVPTYGSTTVMCTLCGSPWGGLIYDKDSDSFRHRLACPRILD